MIDGFNEAGSRFLNTRIVIGLIEIRDYNLYCLNAFFKPSCCVESAPLNGPAIIIIIYVRPFRICWRSRIHILSNRV